MQYFFLPLLHNKLYPARLQYLLGCSILHNKLYPARLQYVTSALREDGIQPEVTISPYHHHSLPGTGFDKKNRVAPLLGVTVSPNLDVFLKKSEGGDLFSKKMQFNFQTLPEAQRTQGIESIT